METGEKIRHLRKLAGLSQMELGELANLPQTTISAIEIGFNSSSIENINKIAKALGVTINELVS